MKIESSLLVPMLADRYGLVDPHVELLRAGFNDNYVVEAGGARYVLRLYLNDKYYIDSPDDFRFELDMLTHLAARGIPVAAPIPQRDGELLGSFDAASEHRWLALFPFAPGEQPGEDTPLPLAELGRGVARMHIAADAFASPYHRYALDRTYLLDEPVRLMAEVYERFGRGSLGEAAEHLSRMGTVLDGLPRDDGAFGLIHGDLHGRNLHVDGSSFMLFDFDHSGYGWRAYDLATVKLGLSEELFGEFLDAYREVRPPSQRELDGIAVFEVLRAVWDIGDVLAMHAAWKKDVPEQACDEIARVLDGVVARAPR